MARHTGRKKIKLKKIRKVREVDGEGKMGVKNVEETKIRSEKKGGKDDKRREKKGGKGNGEMSKGMKKDRKRGGTLEKIE